MKDNLYTVWRIPKRKGGFRQIESPCDELKKKQKALLKKLREAFKVSPFAYAFQPYKNIAVCAQPHVGKTWVACIDIKDFFPSITYDSFRLPQKNTNGWDPKGLLDCFHDFGDGKGLRLPQGAPTSPFLSNAYLLHFDWLMAWKCAGLDCDYTRYADDLVVSGENKGRVLALLKIAEQVLEKDYGLEVNHKKTKVVHRTRRQLVCGVVVNRRLNTPRRLRKNLRAEIYQQKLKGGELSNETKGRIAFHKMVRESTKTTYSSRELIDQIKLAKKLEATT